MSRQLARYALFPLVVALLLSACDTPQKKREDELAKTTFACQLNGERFVVRFAEGEARILLPGMQRVTLYQLPDAPPACATATARWNCAAGAPNCSSSPTA